ncbi:MAG TPA: beta-ketoacyl-[acyl-carrier-protein] synthase family protein [Mycobacteriales bacterium]|nr:beta-ketoacyl-[acyl-carrier-protein] synthase family protein [Mycobacteriales bacterium]
MTGTPARSVLVTGLGATTPLGGDMPATWRALLDGQSGASVLADEWAADLPVRLAARAAHDPADLLPAPRMRSLDRSQQFAMIAGLEAWRDAGAPEVDPERLAVVVSSGIGGVTTLLDQYDVLRSSGARRVSPFTVPMIMPNGPAATLALELSARAGAHSPVSACASGAEAIGYGLQMIRDGRADVVVCGGAEAAIHPLPLAAFAAMRALSSRHEEPKAASRPFDKQRDGFVLAEGAAVIVLEAAEHARARGASTYAVLAGAGMANDAHHVAAPEPEGRGAAAAIAAAVEDAGISFGDIAHINAHATSTPAGDVAEAAAIRRAFEGHADRIAVTSTKSCTGHLLGAAGALEAAITCLTLRDRVVPATANLDDPDDAVQLDLVRMSPRDLAPGGAALSNSFGFGGHDVALVFTEA